MDINLLLQGQPVLAQLAENIQQVVWVFEPGAEKILYVSPAFETVWGRPHENLTADKLTLFRDVHPEDRIKVISAAREKYRHSHTITFRIIRPDGSLRWITAQVILVRVYEPNGIWQVWFARDVTPQNQIEHSLRSALDRSREQFSLSRRMSLARKPESVLKTLMSASELRPAWHGLVLLFDHAGRQPPPILEVISAWTSSRIPVALSPEIMLNDAAFTKELEMSAVVQAANPVIITDIAHDARLTAGLRSRLQEYRMQTFAFFPLVALAVRLGCLVVLYEHPHPVNPFELRHLKVLVDQAAITLVNLRLLEVEAESRREAERANEIKTRFLAMISHELRTPLTSIKGFTSTLLAEDVTWTADEQNDFIETIEQEAARLQELIDHLLDLSRLEAGMLPINRLRIGLQEIVNDILPQAQVITQRHTLTFNLPADIRPVWVDAKRIAQVLVNLVQNAAQYSPPGTDILVSASPRESYLEISVSDQGPGIPPADRKRAFRAFERGPGMENSAGKGAGLGLAICRGLVDAHGGRIWIRRQHGPGTTITFTVPLYAGIEPAEAAEKE